MVRLMKFGLLLAVLSFAGSCWAAAPADRPAFEFGPFRLHVLKALHEGRTNQALEMARAKTREHPDNFRVHALLGEIHETRREFADAIKAHTAALALDPDADALYQKRGQCRFQLGDFTGALEDFDELLRRNPKDVPQHWQRGIAFHYAGQFGYGVKQFELHQTVNAADCETALWHWLCVARVSGTNAAIKAMFPFADDPRPPMRQIHALYAGQGTVEAVLTAAEENPRLDIRPLGRFYARLYLGLYYETMGDPVKSVEWLRQAVELADVAGFMGDVARVHPLLRVRPAPAKESP